MNWEHILQNDRPAEPLRKRIDDLFAQQRETWPALRDGEAALAHLQRKTLTDGDQSIIVQVNPARRRSTLANTDAKAVAARACFLCPENMPPEERGVAFEDLVVMPNPFPILPLHCTIAAREHRPQKLDGQIGKFLRLAKAIGPDLAALYNGPRCGASAPDHFHFQAVRENEIPILAQLPSLDTASRITPHTTFGRNLLLITGSNADAVAANVERSVNALRQIEVATDEPMLNLLAHFSAGRYAVALFPRAAHRPKCYFATGPEQLLISPAVLEMCGILVATELDHFERINAPIAGKIYEEVSLNPEHFARLVAAAQ
jgi:hypothetical protein